VDISGEVSFGAWRVVDVRPKILFAENSVVEVWLTPTDLVLIDAGAQAQVTWPVGRITVDAPGASDAYVRLGTEAALLIKPTDGQPAGDLLEAIVARRRSTAALARNEPLIGTTAPPKAGPSWLKFGCVFSLVFPIAIIVWLWIAFSNYNDTTGEASGGIGAANLAAAVVVFVGLLLALAAGGIFSPPDH